MAKKEDKIYEDKNYIIYKKNVEVTGDLISGLELVDIGIKRIKYARELAHFANSSDKIKVVAKLKKRLSDILMEQITT